MNQVKLPPRRNNELKKDLIICPTCKGEGTRAVVAKILDEKGWYDAPPVVMSCSLCEGKKVVSKKWLEAREEAYKDFWCACKGDALRDSIYYADGEHLGCSKHHYRCRTCGKVTQVG